MSAYMDFAQLDEQVVALLSAFVLCFLLGMERHLHLKDAGIKTHVLVGVGACLFTLVGAYGFHPLMGSADIRFDPSRIAAQIVSGIGFLGAGVIFVNNDTVRGLTTAATVWMSAAIGMACGAHMIPIATMTLVLHYIVVFGVGPLTKRLPQVDRDIHTIVHYRTGYAVMPTILRQATKLGFVATLVKSTTLNEGDDSHPKEMRVILHFTGASRLSRQDLTYFISSLEGVDDVENVESSAVD